MNIIKTIRFAIIDSEGRLGKVGSSGRPATFSTLNNASKWLHRMNHDQRLVRVLYEEFEYEEVD